MKESEETETNSTSVSPFLVDVMSLFNISEYPNRPLPSVALNRISLYAWYNNPNSTIQMQNEQ
jgi:hypothetical protein